jgi:hypothetical protein
VLKAKISISSTYFSAVETMIDFFNRIGQKQTLTDIPFWTDRLPSSRRLSLLSDFEVNIDGDE